MKIVPLIFFVIVTSFTISYGQNNELKVDISKIKESISTSSIETKLGNQIIKDELCKHSDTLKNKVIELSKIVEQFNVSILQMTDEFIEKAGGLDTKGRPVLFADKNVTNQYFIIGGKGEELKHKIEKTRAQILSFVSPEYVEEVSKLIPLTVNDTNLSQSNKKWEEYKFKNMPVAVILPMLTFLTYNANSSERIILDYWRLKYQY